MADIHECEGRQFLQHRQEAISLKPVVVGEMATLRHFVCVLVQTKRLDLGGGSF